MFKFFQSTFTFSAIVTGTAVSCTLLLFCFSPCQGYIRKPGNLDWVAMMVITAATMVERAINEARKKKVSKTEKVLGPRNFWSKASIRNYTLDDLSVDLFFQIPVLLGIIVLLSIDLCALFLFFEIASQCIY